MTTCSATRQDGSPCRAYALLHEQYCFTHHPDRGSERTLARVAGGRARAAAILPAEPSRHALDRPGDVAALMTETIGYVLRGELDPRTANAVGYLATVLLKALEQGDLEARIQRIETAMQPGAVVGLLHREPAPPLRLPGEADE